MGPAPVGSQGHTPFTRMMAGLERDISGHITFLGLFLEDKLNSPFDDLGVFYRMLCTKQFDMCLDDRVYTPFEDSCDEV